MAHRPLKPKKSAFLTTLKLPLVVAVSSCLLVACSTKPANKRVIEPTPVALPPSSDVALATDDYQTDDVVSYDTGNNVIAVPEMTGTQHMHPSGLDAETLKILGDLLAARDMKMVQNDKILIEQYGNLWDRVRDGYRLRDANNARINNQLSWFFGRQEYFNRLTARASRYLHYTVAEAERRGIPTELALLPIIESSYDPSATSNAAAAGLWQFIPSTGRIYGLTQSDGYDARRDVIESTRAAYDFLTSLYNQFGSWELALAAYNAGPGRVQRAINFNATRGLPTDYWSLSLPNETMNYVPRFFAIAKIVANPEEMASVSLPSIADHVYFRTVPVKYDVTLDEVSAIIKVDVPELQLLNPALRYRRVDRAGPSRILIPNAVDKALDVKLQRLGVGDTPILVENVSYISPKNTTSISSSRRSTDELLSINALPTTGASITSNNTIEQEPALTDEERQNVVAQIRQSDTTVRPVNQQDGNIDLNAVQTAQSVLAARQEIKSLNYGDRSSYYNPNVYAAQNAVAQPATQLSYTQPPATQPNYAQVATPQPPATAYYPQTTNYPQPTSPQTTAPNPLVTEAVSANVRPEFYIIQSGDSLGSIAAKFRVSVAQLREWNNIVGDTIYHGRRLNLYPNANTALAQPTTQTATPSASNPSRQTTAKKTNTPTKTVNAPKVESYKVRAGDTLTQLARDFNLTLAQLAAYNQLSTKAELRVGQTLWLVDGKMPAKADKPAAKTTAPATQSYTIKPSDTLTKIANQHGISVAELAKMNGLTDLDLVVEGSTLTVPAQTSKSNQAQTQTKVSNQTSRSKPAPNQTYTIQSNDTLTKIANQHGISVAELAKMNGLTDLDLVVEGSTLTVPAQASNQTSRSNKAQDVKLNTQAKTDTRNTKDTAKTEAYKVQAGESLTVLAERYQLSVAELAKINGLSRNAQLQLGQVINVPKLTQTYVVKSGDNLIQLARRYDIDVKELVKMNNLKSNDVLRIGQKLIVPNK